MSYLSEIAKIAMEKRADAMARAFQRGDIKLDTAKKQIEFSEKLQRIPQRTSGNMGMLGAKPFASGAEGDVTMGAMRGKGLGVRKTFHEPIPGSLEATMDFHQLKTRTIDLRAGQMKAMPDIYPEVYGHKSKVPGSAYGTIDMEFIPGKNMADTKYRKGRKAYKYLDNYFKNRGYVGVGPSFHHPASDVFVGDLHGHNVKIDARTGKPKIIDPMIHKRSDPSILENIKNNFANFGIKPGQRVPAPVPGQRSVLLPSQFTSGHLRDFYSAAQKQMAHSQPIVNSRTGRGLGLFAQFLDHGFKVPMLVGQAFKRIHR